MSIAREISLVFFIAILLVGSLTFRSFLSNESSADPLFEIARIFGLIAVMIISISAAKLPEIDFRRVMSIVALSHALLLVIALLSAGGAAIRLLSDSPLQQRFEVGGIETAAWAEISLGTIFAAVLSGRHWVVGISGSVALYVMLAADMRTTLVAAFVTLLIYVSSFVLGIRNKRSKSFILLMMLSITVAAGSAFASQIREAISDLLLLEDYHRGIGSGFSGRFTNIALGFEFFLDRPVLGHGLANPIVNYTHNGYVMTLAQMGFFVSIILFALLLIALTNAFSRRDYLSFACIVGLILFYMGQPRNINLQLCPLVGLFACSRHLISRSGRWSSRIDEASLRTQS